VAEQRGSAVRRRIIIVTIPNKVVEELPCTASLFVSPILKIALSLFG
jgi:hypothetical protein